MKALHRFWREKQNQAAFYTHHSEVVCSDPNFKPKSSFDSPQTLPRVRVLIVLLQAVLALGVRFDKIQNVVIRAEQAGNQREARWPPVIVWKFADEVRWNTWLVQPQIFMDLLVGQVDVLREADELHLLVAEVWLFAGRSVGRRSCHT